MQNEAQYHLDRKAAKISELSSNNLDKYEYLTDKDLGLKPSTIEQAIFEYSPLGKMFNRGLDKNDQKEGLFKILKNIEGKIKGQNKKESEPIDNEEQLEVLKDESTMVDKKPNFGSNFNSTGKQFFIRLAKDERKIDYSNLFFEID